MNESLPETLTETVQQDEDFLKTMHKVLLEYEVEEGELICPETGRKFPISKGIPNMLLQETEVSWMVIVSWWLYLFYVFVGDQINIQDNKIHFFILFKEWDLKNTNLFKMIIIFVIWANKKKG